MKFSNAVMSSCAPYETYGALWDTVFPSQRGRRVVDVVGRGACWLIMFIKLPNFKHVSNFSLPQSVSTHPGSLSLIFRGSASFEGNLNKVNK